MPPRRNADTGGPQGTPPTPTPGPRAVGAGVLAAIEDAAASLRGRDLRGEELARAVAEVSARYTRAREELTEDSTSQDALCARLRFFLPRDLPKIEAPLAELARAGAWTAKPTLRVLDLGSGLGATALGAARYALRAGLAERVEVTAVDRDRRALELGETLAQAIARREALALGWSTRAEALSASSAAGEAPDLILLGFVLNELAEGVSEDDALERQRELLQALVGRLPEGGALIALEPALRPHSRRLSRLRDRLIADAGPAHVFAPCLHRGPCPMLERERDWCHESLPLALPEPVAAIAREAGLREAHLTYSYLTLTRAPGSLAALAADRAGYRVVSQPLRSKGKVELLICTDGPLRSLRRLDRHRSAHNRVVEDLGRGSVVAVQGAQPRGPRLEVLQDTDIEVLQTVAPDDEATPPM